MKKKIMLFIFLFMMCPLFVKADHIYDIKMDIYIDEFGNANVAETWDVKATDGSEWYKTMYELNNSQLTDYKVTRDGKELIFNDYWNVDASLKEKTGYYGINYASKGIELCFGKGDYSRHKYVVSYKLSNYVFNVDDAQVLAWVLYPKATVDRFSATITSYYKFPDSLDVWGYGYKGYAYVKDGKIELSTENGLDDTYVSALVKFPLNTFTTENKDYRYKTFNDVYTVAQEGTFDYDYDNGNYNKSSVGDRILGFLMEIINILIPIAIFSGIFIRMIIRIIKSGYGYKNNKVIDKENVPMFRDIPCNKDIYYANALMNLNNFDYKETNIFGAIILKWLRQGKIAFKNETKGIFNKETSMIDLTLNPSFDNELEVELFDMMYKASKDGILESKELETWAKRNYSAFFNVFNKITNNKIDELKANGHIYKRIDKNECKKKNVMDDMIYNDSCQLYGLKKFLKEFSDMKNKEAIEVNLWDEYLMFAYLFGMADKVAKQFKNLYPEIVQEMESCNLDYGTFMYINSISTRTVSAASAARSAAESYSGGGGGFSSGGGGGFSGGFSGGGGGSAGGR